METIIYYLASFLAVTMVLTFHEFAHSFVAVKCGDDTPKRNGRLSLNPLRHFDVFGLVMFVAVGFGWAKPVPINPYNFRNPRKGIILTSAAGVILNFIMAFLLYPVFVIVEFYMPVDNYLQLLVESFVYLSFIYSISFCVFNLLPFYPLDGYNVLEGICRGRGKVIHFLKRYGYYILMGLIIESFIVGRIADYFPVAASFDILGYVLSFARNIVAFPITKFWDLILGLIL